MANAQAAKYANEAIWTQIENLQFEPEALLDEDLDFDALVLGIEKVGFALGIPYHTIVRLIEDLERAAGVNDPSL